MKRKSAEGPWRVVEAGLSFCPMKSTYLPSPPNKLVEAEK